MTALVWKVRIQGALPKAHAAPRSTPRRPARRLANAEEGAQLLGDASAVAVVFEDVAARRGVARIRRSRAVRRRRTRYDPSAPASGPSITASMRAPRVIRAVGSSDLESISIAHFEQTLTYGKSRDLSLTLRELPTPFANSATQYDHEFGAHLRE